MRNGVRCFWGIPVGSLVLLHEYMLRKEFVKKQRERMKNRKR